MSEQLTHIGWDRGLIAEVVDPLLAVELGIHSPPAKTTTAICGKRVAAARIDNQAATCPACRAEVTSPARATLELLAAHPELRRHSRDPKALVDALLEDLARFGSPPMSRDRDLDRALLGCGAAHLTGHSRDPIVLQPGCRCGTRPAIPPTTDAATTAHHPAAKKEGCRPATTPLSAVPLSKGVHAMFDATLWQVDMGDGTWAVSCLACQQPLYRGAKAEADRVFDSHTCEPIVPLTTPTG